MGLHHVTAIAGDPQRTLDFYAGTLGLRLVKLTVNFDDPGTYHFYCGDEIGRPGSLLTFFPWPGGAPGRAGAGQVNEVSLAVPAGSLGAWIERLLSRGVSFTGPTSRFDERVLAFRDPDDLLLEIVVTPRVGDAAPWTGGPVPAEHAIRGLHSATIWEDGDRGTATLLTGTLGYRRTGEAGERIRFESGAGPGSVIDLRRTTGFWSGAGGVGTVHHIAFQAGSDEALAAGRTELERLGLAPTPVVNRQYFHSVYFREPGGILFELATDGPGFLIDETAADLGTSLRLPPVFEPMREELQRALPPLHLPQIATPEAP